MIKWHDQVDAARVEFEKQWQPSSLAVVDNELYERFRQQEELWNAAYMTGTAEDIEVQAGGMVRAYQAASKRLEGHRMTAFLVGHDQERGKSVCISGHSESVPYAERGTDYPVIWVTPDAVARLVARTQEMGIIIDDKEDRLS